jgi:hypothetical protein
MINEYIEFFDSFFPEFRKYKLKSIIFLVLLLILNYLNAEPKVQDKPILKPWINISKGQTIDV